ncbi:gluconate 2-dehydrogenase subunit 3 family protein [Emticicia sp. BO119]|uniref:gluconate 2-dehydrogenase subunit 3 family protein n=1 Tax=Emticicia sp. BO119 TaxID=2757768 RepID=UPI0015F070D9|nr:gluconate 2-dehydrogenase subunit 3 family protein [Emticicia sp. BO119]MBA4853471.1 gluconate 2-dehydrogenase subunit 3 family protein [Emticicia sp. BO119]
MNRRIAIRDLTLALGGLVSIPAWATDGWNTHSFQLNQSFLKVSEQNMLEVIVETIIPESTTKGAKSLGVPAFLQKMLQDCYEAPVSENIRNGLAATDTTAQKQFGKSFADCDTQQKQQILLSFEKSQDTKLKDFYSLVKNLTILGYTTSEYVQTEFLRYNMAPGHYYGCVPVKK